MTPEQLELLEQLDVAERAATPAPVFDKGSDCFEEGEWCHVVSDEKDLLILVSCPFPGDRSHDTRKGLSGHAPADAAFISLARNLIRPLLDERKKLLAHCEALRAQLDGRMVRLGVLPSEEELVYQEQVAAAQELARAAEPLSEFVDDLRRTESLTSGGRYNDQDSLAMQRGELPGMPTVGQLRNLAAAFKKFKELNG